MNDSIPEHEGHLPNNHERVTRDTHLGQTEVDERNRLTTEIGQESLPQGSERFMFRADTSWEKVTENQDRIAIDVGFDVEDFLETDDIQNALPEERDLLRERIYRYVAEEMIPQIVRDSHNGQIPEIGELSTSHDINTNCSTRHEGQNGRYSSFNQMAIAVSLNSNRDVHPLAAMYNARGGIASSVADMVIHNIENHYLGTTKSSVESSSKFQGDRVQEYELEKVT